MLSQGRPNFVESQVVTRDQELTEWRDAVALQADRHQQVLRQLLDTIRSHFDV